MNNYIENYLTSEIEKSVDENGDATIRVTNSEYGINDILVLENDSKNILLNGEIAGCFTSTGNTDPYLFMNPTAPSNASENWTYRGTTDYTITSTGATAVATVLGILSLLLSPAIAEQILGAV